MAAITASRAAVSDGSGFLAAATTTATEIGYVSGVTSAIQPQVNAKLPTTITTTGDIIYSSAGTTASRLAIGSAGHVLTVSSGLPAWQAVTVSPTAVTQQSANYTALTSDEHIECTANTFTVTLYAVASNSGRKLTISNTGTGVITIDPNAAETFNDGTSVKYLSQDQSVDLQCNGAEWIVRNFTPLTGYVYETQVSGTSAGGATANTVQIRDLASGVATGDLTKFGSVDTANDRISLEAGTYDIDAWASAYKTNRHQLFVYNVTAGAYILDQIHSVAALADSTDDQVTHAKLSGRFSITATSSIELRHWTQSTQATSGLGLAMDSHASNPQEKEVYMVVKLTKLV